MEQVSCYGVSGVSLVSIPFTPSVLSFLAVIQKMRGPLIRDVLYSLSLPIRGCIANCWIFMSLA